MPQSLHKAISPELMTRTERQELAFGLLTEQQRRAAESFLLGWLSNVVSLDEYANAIRATLAHLDRFPHVPHGWRK